MLKKYYPYYFFAGILLLFSFAYPCEKLKFLYEYFEINKAFDIINYLNLFSILLLPIAIYFASIQKFLIAIWFTFLTMILIIFYLPFYHIYFLNWEEIIPLIFGMIITYYLIITTKKPSNFNKFFKILIHIFFIVFLIVTIISAFIVNNEIDNFSTVTIYCIAIYGIILYRTYFNFKNFKIILILFYVFSFVLLIFTNQCYVIYREDVIFDSFKIKNLISNCSTIFLWFLSTIIVQVTIFLEEKKSNLKKL